MSISSIYTLSVSVTGTITITAGAGIQAGDLVVFGASSYQGSQINIGGPASVTQIAANCGASTYFNSTWLGAKVGATGDNGASFAFTNMSGSYSQICVMVLRNTAGAFTSAQISSSYIETAGPTYGAPSATVPSSIASGQQLIVALFGAMTGYGITSGPTLPTGYTNGVSSFASTYEGTCLAWQVASSGTDYGGAFSWATGTVYSFNNGTVDVMGIPLNVSLAVTASDSAPATETVARNRGFPRASSDTSSGTDAASQVRHLSSTAFDTEWVAASYDGDGSDTYDSLLDVYDGPTNPDVATVQLGRGRTSSDTAHATEVPTRIAAHPRSVTDATVGADTTTRIATHPRAVSDATGGTETNNPDLRFARSGSDTAHAIDTGTRTARFARATSQVVREPPTSILDIVNMVPNNVGYITDDPDTPDANWILSNEIAQPCSIRAKLTSPVANPVGTQEFRVRLRPSQ